MADSHLVNDVDVAIDCRQVGGEDGCVSNADHLKQKNNTLSDSDPRSENISGVIEVFLKE